VPAQSQPEGHKHSPGWSGLLILRAQPTQWNGVRKDHHRWDARLGNVGGGRLKAQLRYERLHESPNRSLPHEMVSLVVLV